MLRQRWIKDIARCSKCPNDCPNICFVQHPIMQLRPTCTLSRMQPSNFGMPNTSFDWINANYIGKR